jgi:hypothetical protein
MARREGCFGDKSERWTRIDESPKIRLGICRDEDNAGTILRRIRSWPNSVKVTRDVEATLRWSNRDAVSGHLHRASGTGRLLRCQDGGRLPGGPRCPRTVPRARGLVLKGRL